MGDCHSFDPGSKFGLERKTNKKKKPNEHPGPGAAYTFFSISNAFGEKLQQNLGNRDSPSSQTGLHDSVYYQPPKSASIHEKNDTSVVSPLVENRSPLVENNSMHTGDSKNSPLLLSSVVKTKSSKIDVDGFKQYLLAQRKINWKQILQKAIRHGHIL